MKENLNPLKNIERRLKLACDTLDFDDSIYEVLRHTKRTIEVSIPVKMDNGKTKIFVGYRALHNDTLGPGKGGIRFHPNVSIDEIKALAIWMSLKCGIAKLPYGGAKGGVIVDPSELSSGELERLSRGYIQETYNFLGENIDIPAPDVNTNGQVMAWMVDEYSKIKGSITMPIITGKPLEWGGSKGRIEATGYGVSIIAQAVLDEIGIDIKGASVALQGFGNVGSFSAKYLQENGAKIVSIAKRDFAIYNESGIDYESVKEFLTKDKDLRNYKSAKLISLDEFWSLKLDLLIPAALENAITIENASKVRAKVIVEAANGPITPDADKILEDKDVLVVPDILANAGGVTVSYFEWLQNKYGYYWNAEEIMEKEKEILIKAFNELWSFKNNGNSTFRKAAYKLGVKRITDIMKMRSWI